jgi:hypothetical protein
MRVQQGGEVNEIMALWQVIQLPIFPVPACIDGRPYGGGIKQISMDVFELSERREQVASRHGVEQVLAPWMATF